MFATNEPDFGERRRTYEVREMKQNFKLKKNYDKTTEPNPQRN